MKAVVLEINDGFAAVLSDDGRILKVKDCRYEIGQEIQINNSKMKFSKKVATFISAAAAIFMVSTGIWAYASPYSYVSLDVNPSIEFSANRFDRVIKVNAVNDDGKEILKSISSDNLKNATIADALKNTVDKLSSEGYFDGEVEGGIVLTTSGQDVEKAKELAHDLQFLVETQVVNQGDLVQVEAYHVGLDYVREAHTLGVTPGKLRLVKKLKASALSPSSINIKEWLDKPVKDIMKATKDNRKLSVTTSPSINNKKDTFDEITVKEKNLKAETNNIKNQEKQKDIKDKKVSKKQETSNKLRLKSQKELNKSHDKIKTPEVENKQIKNKHVYNEEGKLEYKDNRKTTNVENNKTFIHKKTASAKDKTVKSEPNQKYSEKASHNVSQHKIQKDEQKIVRNKITVNPTVKPTINSNPQQKNNHQNSKPENKSNKANNNLNNRDHNSDNGNNNSGNMNSNSNNNNIYNNNNNSDNNDNNLNNNKSKNTNNSSNNENNSSNNSNNNLNNGSNNSNNNNNSNSINNNTNIPDSNSNNENANSNNSNNTSEGPHGSSGNNGGNSSKGK